MHTAPSLLRNPKPIKELLSPDEYAVFLDQTRCVEEAAARPEGQEPAEERGCTRATIRLCGVENRSARPGDPGRSSTEPSGHHAACQRGAVFATRTSARVKRPATARLVRVGRCSRGTRSAVGLDVESGEGRPPRLNIAPRRQAAWWRGGGLGGRVAGAEHRLDGGKLRRGGDTSVGQILRFPSSSASMVSIRDRNPGFEQRACRLARAGLPSDPSA